MLADRDAPSGRIQRRRGRIRLRRERRLAPTDRLGTDLVGTPARRIALPAGERSRHARQPLENGLPGISRRTRPERYAFRVVRRPYRRRSLRGRLLRPADGRPRRTEIRKHGQSDAQGVERDYLRSERVPVRGPDRPGRVRALQRQRLGMGKRALPAGRIRGRQTDRPVVRAQRFDRAVHGRRGRRFSGRRNAGVRVRRGRFAQYAVARRKPQRHLQSEARGPQHDVLRHGEPQSGRPAPHSLRHGERLRL